MADESRAIIWILNQASTLNLAIERFSWIEEALPGWTDVHCSISFQDEVLHGWGAGPSEDLALCKAFAEVAERAVVKSTDARTSNGFAAHLSHQDARINAIRELEERDLFLCHFYTKTPFQSASLISEKWNWFERLQTWARGNKLSVRFFHLGERGVVCVISGFDQSRPFGYVIGASVGETIERSALSAFIEAGRRCVRIIHRQGPTDSLTIQDFLSLPRPTFSDHGRLALDLSYANQITYLFQGENAAKSNCCIFPQLENDVSDLTWPVPSASKCPFYFAKATSSKAQSLFLGPPSRTKLNLARLEQFFGKPLIESEINPLPHPFD